MQISARDILGLPIYTRVEEKKVARASGLIVLPDNGKIVALLAATGFWGQPKLVAAEDILEIKENKIFIHSQRELLELDEIISAKKTLEQKIQILGSRVYTEEGKKLGQVTNFWFDHEGWYLTKIEVGPSFNTMFLKKILVGWKDIIKIEPGKIIISADIILDKVVDTIS